MFGFKREKKIKDRNSIGMKFNSLHMFIKQKQQQQQITSITSSAK
jgi:hypothetical protein